MRSEGNRFQRLALFAVPQGLRGRSRLFVQLWWIVQALLFRPSPQVLYGWRVWLLRRFGAEIGRGVIIRPSVRVTYPWKLKIGDDSWIGDRTELYTLESITIGSNSCVSQDCYICTGSHDMSALDFRYDCRPVVIEDEAWLAAGSFVGPGVTIGRGTVIGARSLVLRDVAGGQVCAGNPLRVIRNRDASK